MRGCQVLPFDGVNARAFMRVIELAMVKGFRLRLRS